MSETAKKSHGYQLSMSIVSKIETDIDDLLLPYKIDMSINHVIENTELIEHIDRVGICIYERIKR